MPSGAIDRRRTRRTRCRRWCRGCAARSATRRRSASRPRATASASNRTTWTRTGSRRCVPRARQRCATAIRRARPRCCARRSHCGAGRRRRSSCGACRFRAVGRPAGRGGRRPGHAPMSRSATGASAVPELDALVAQLPLDERVAAAQVTALAHAGRQADALRAYERIRARLADELGVDPSADLQAVHLSVLRGEIDRTSEEAAAPRTNLKAQLTSFVGRDEEIARVGKALQENRLVTLVGPGGAGKTRLANEAGAKLVTRDGVWLAELAPVTRRRRHRADRSRRARPAREESARPAPVARRRSTPRRASSTCSRTRRRCSCSTTASTSSTRAPGSPSTCSVGARPARARDQPRAARHHRRGRPRRAAARAAGRRMLRPRLRSNTPPCACSPTALRQRVPTSASTTRTSRPSSTSCAAWTVCRSRSNSPRRGCAPCRWPTSPSDSPTASGCSPAAAARPCPGTAPCARSSSGAGTCSATPERLLVERLAVFPAGVTVDSAVAVAGGRCACPPADVPELLAALVDKSLLQRVGDGARLRMLETIREYGAERLGERGELEDGPPPACGSFRRAARGRRAAPDHAPTSCRGSTGSPRSARTSSPHCASAATSATRTARWRSRSGSADSR